jgi:hypothetical protein
MTVQDMERVERLLDEAYKIARTWPSGRDTTIGLGSYLAGLRMHIWSAHDRLPWWIEQERRHLAQDDSETAYFGNMAAFGGKL